MRRFGIQTWLGCAALLLGVSVVRGQTDSPQPKLTEHGTLWQRTNENAKGFYIVGFIHGARMATTSWRASLKPIPSQKEINDQWEIYDSKGFSTDEMVTLMNHFYADETNHRISFPFALMYVFRKIQGASEEELKAIVLALREPKK
jgi:hypothetical protein